MKQNLHNSVDKNVDVTWKPRVEGHLFYHPIGMADPHDEASEISLDFFTWLGDAMMQAAPYSRVASAVGLTGGLTAGAASAVILSGHDYNGKPIDKEKFPKFMQKAIGVLDHNPEAKDLMSRSKRFAVRYVLPASMGGAAVWAGSRFYFDVLRKDDDIKNPHYLEDFASASADRQARPWGVLSAVTSLFASASGASFLPINYGVAVNTQSYMESGHRVMLPGIGKAVSNNHSTLSFGTKELEHFMARYTANNPSIHPERLEQLWAALVKPHFPDVTKDQIQHLVDDTHRLRDPYMKRMLDGEDPGKVRAEMEQFFTKQFSKEGLWEMLSNAGIDPAKANVVNNGLAGKIGNAMGARKDIKKMQHAYEEKVQAWQAAHASQSSPVVRHTQGGRAEAVVHQDPQSAVLQPQKVISQVQHNYLRDPTQQNQSAQAI
jgi:hypothetical protein